MALGLFPGWCAVAQMGHVVHRGHATVDTSLGIPMVRVELPALEGDDEYLPLDAQVVLVAPGSLYAVTPITEADARRSRSIYRERRPVATPLLVAPPEPLPASAEAALQRAGQALVDGWAGDHARGIDDGHPPEGCRPVDDEGLGADEIEPAVIPGAGCAHGLDRVCDSCMPF